MPPLSHYPLPSSGTPSPAHLGEGCSSAEQRPRCLRWKGQPDLTLAVEPLEGQPAFSPLSGAESLDSRLPAPECEAGAGLCLAEGLLLR